MPHVDRTFAEFDDSIALLWQVGVGQDCSHTSQCFSPGRVDRFDIGMSVRAAERRPEEHARQLSIRAVLSSASDFVDAIVADRSSSDNFVLGLFSSSHNRLLGFARDVLCLENLRT
jgi:hypothetical protein